MITLCSLMELLGLDNSSDFCFSDDCTIDETGVFAKPLDKHNSDLLVGKEWYLYKEFEENIRLELPCSLLDANSWIERNGLEWSEPVEESMGDEGLELEPVIINKTNEVLATASNSPNNNASQLKRTSQLHSLIAEVYSYLDVNKKPKTAQKVWDEIRHRAQEYEGGDIIQEVTKDALLWVSGGQNEGKLKRLSFDSLFSKLKRKLICRNT